MKHRLVEFTTKRPKAVHPANVVYVQITSSSNYPMCMMALRDGLMNCEGIIDVIPLKDEDMRKMVREDASSHKPGQTSTDHDRTVPQALHESRPPVGQNSSIRAWRRDNIFLSYFAATKLNFGLHSRFLDLAPIALFHNRSFLVPVQSMSRPRYCSHHLPTTRSAYFTTRKKPTHSPGQQI
jgi:hypothetical protein